MVFYKKKIIFLVLFSGLTVTLLAPPLSRRSESALLGNLLNRDEGISVLNDVIERLDGDIEVQERRFQLLNPVQRESPEGLELLRKIAENRLKKESFETRLEGHFKPPTVGNLIAKGLAGKQEKYLTGRIEDVGEGIRQGITVSVSHEFGSVLSDRVRGILERVFGRPCDFIVSKIIDLWDDLYTLLFHSGNEPFTKDGIEGLRRFVRASFDDIEKIVKDGLSHSLRSHDMPIRQSALVTASSDNGDSVEFNKDEQDEDAWFYLVQGYAQQFDRFIIELEMRKAFYADTTLEVFYAKQIQERLGTFARILERSKSLSELDTALNSNKAIIPAIKNNIDNLFKSLSDQITPRSYSFSKENSSSFYDQKDFKKSRISSYQDNDDYPASLWGSR